MINPDSSRALNRNTVIVEDVVDIQVLNYHIGCVGDGDTCASDSCTVAIANKALVGADLEARRKDKVTLDDNGEGFIALLESDMFVRWIGCYVGIFPTWTAVASAAAAVTVVVGPPFPPVVSPKGFSLAYPSRANSFCERPKPRPGTATAAPARRLAVRASVSFIFPKARQASIGG